jgi:hypothetical protein
MLYVVLTSTSCFLNQTFDNLMEVHMGRTKLWLIAISVAKQLPSILEDVRAAKGEDSDQGKKISREEAREIAEEAAQRLVPVILSAIVD